MEIKFVRGFTITQHSRNSAAGPYSIKTPEGETFENLRGIAVSSTYFPSWSAYLFLLVGICLFALAGWQFVKFQKSQHQWNVTSGYVTDIVELAGSPAKAKTQASSKFRVEFSFTDGSGTARAFQRTYERPVNFIKGSPIPIRYDPKDSANATLANEAGGRTAAIALFIFSLISLGTGFVVLFYGPFDRLVIASDHLRWEGSHAEGLRRIS